MAIHSDVFMILDELCYSSGKAAVAHVSDEVVIVGCVRKKGLSLTTGRTSALTLGLMSL